MKVPARPDPGLATPAAPVTATLACQHGGERGGVAEKKYSDSDEVTTGVAAKLAGVSHSTLLRYTKAGRISPVSRTLERGDRRYLVADVRALRRQLEEKAAEGPEPTA